MTVEFRRVTQDARIPTHVDSCLKTQCSCFTNPCLRLIKRLLFQTLFVMAVQFPTRQESRYFSKVMDTCKCIVLINPSEIILEPNRIEHQFLRHGIKLTPGLILQVTDHCNDKPWRIPTQLIGVTTKKDSFILPLFSGQQVTIPKFEILAHVQLQPISRALLRLKGIF
jgi:hypothetical protein